MGNDHGNLDEHVEAGSSGDNGVAKNSAAAVCVFVSCGSELKIEELRKFVRLPKDDLSMSMAGLVVCSSLVCMHK